MKSQELITLLKRNGWVLRGSNGPHHTFVHPQHPGHLSVPHPKKDLGIGLVHKLMKQAQIHYPQG